MRPSGERGHGRLYCELSRDRGQTIKAKEYSGKADDQEIKQKEQATSLKARGEKRECIAYRINQVIAPLQKAAIACYRVQSASRGFSTSAFVVRLGARVYLAALAFRFN